MSPGQIRHIRTSLKMTQPQLAQLLGVHHLTVSKWERGILQPSPYHAALLDSFFDATGHDPNIGPFVVGLLLGAGVGVALYHLLRAAFEPDDRAGEALVKHETAAAPAKPS